MRCSLEQKIRSEFQKHNATQRHEHISKHQCAPVCRIHVSFGVNKLPARFCATITGSFMQSGALVTRTENQKRVSKKHNATSLTNAKHQCAPVCRIHVSFGVNEQPESLAVFKAIHSVMQSGALVTRTENQKRVSKIQRSITS